MKNRWWKRHKTRDSCNNIGDWAINQVALPESSAPQVMDIEKTMRTGWFTSDFFLGVPYFQSQRTSKNMLGWSLVWRTVCLGTWGLCRRVVLLLWQGGEFFHVKTVLHGRRSARELGISGEDEDACLKVGYSMKKQDAAHEPECSHIC